MQEPLPSKEARPHLLLICLVTMDQNPCVEGGIHPVVQNIFASETNDLPLETIEIPGSSRQIVGGMWATSTSSFLPHVDLVTVMTGWVHISPHRLHKGLLYHRLDSIEMVLKYVLNICLIIVQWQAENIFGITPNRARYPALIELKHVQGQPLIIEFPVVVNQLEIIIVLKR